MSVDVRYLKRSERTLLIIYMLLGLSSIIFLLIDYPSTESTFYDIGLFLSFLFAFVCGAFLAVASINEKAKVTEVQK